MKIVIDSNVIIAAFAGRGLCSEIFELCLSEHDIYLCDEIIYEVRKNLVKKIKLPHHIVEEIIVYITSQTLKVKPIKLSNRICRDIKDDMILGAAETSEAQVILTGDKDLLTLKVYKGIKIMTSSQFWKLLQSK